MFDQNHKYLGLRFTELWQNLGSKIQTSNEITNTRETAELDTRLSENSHYHQLELVMFSFFQNGITIQYNVFCLCSNGSLFCFVFQIFQSQMKNKTLQ